MIVSESEILDIRKSYFDNGFVHLKDVVDPEIISFMQFGCSTIFHPSSKINFEEDQKSGVVHGEKPSYNSYGNILGDTLLIYLNNFYASLIDKPLMPTYSFIRKYQKGQVLKPHTDRPSCQYSATIALSKEAADWPFFVKDSNKQEVKVLTELGDVIFYMGERVSHWREPLQDEESYHIFLHYIDSSDPSHKQYIFDQREILGSGLKN